MGKSFITVERKRRKQNKNYLNCIQQAKSGKNYYYVEENQLKYNGKSKGAYQSIK